MGASSVESKEGKYLTLISAQWFEIGKTAAKHDVIAELRCFEKKYLNLTLKETSVRCLRNLYQENWRCKVLKMR